MILHLFHHYLILRLPLNLIFLSSFLFPPLYFFIQSPFFYHLLFFSKINLLHLVFILIFFDLLFQSFTLNKTIYFFCLQWCFSRKINFTYFPFFFLIVLDYVIEPVSIDLCKNPGLQCQLCILILPAVFCQEIKISVWTAILLWNNVNLVNWK